MSIALSTRHQRFAPARLPDPYLTHSRCAFSATLTTPALNRRSMRWFETSPCRAIPGGQPPSLAQHRSAGSDLYIVTFLSFVAHSDTERSRDIAAARRARERSARPGRAVGCSVSVRLRLGSRSV